MEEKIKNNKLQILTANALKIIAVIFMMCDHLWATIISGSQWLTIVGRIAFPIFSFLIVEGFFHTKDFKKYIRRLFIFALISEIPFNLMLGGSLIFPFKQNVMFTFLIALLFINLMEKAYKKGRGKFIKSAINSCAIGFLVGTFLMVDYIGYGILMTFGFYFAKKLPKPMIWQFISMFIINVLLMEGQEIPFNIFNNQIFIPMQAFALLALIPIWLYNGKLGRKNKIIQYGFYIIYPLHMLIFSVLALYIFK